MDVSRSAYYDWTHLVPTATDQEDRSLTELVVAAFQKSRNTYGTRRLKRELFEQNRQISRRRIGRLMNEANLACKTKRKFKVTTDSRHNLPVAENHLNRQFSTEKPNQVYVGDITYISTQEGWLYLAVVIDLYSRQVVGWSMAEHMKTKLVNDALLMALWKRKPVHRLTLKRS
jgi:transposase InsO family protein